MSTRLTFVGFCTLLLALFTVLTGCTGAKKTGASNRVETASTASSKTLEPQPEEGKEEEEIDREANEAIERALARAREGEWRDLHLLCECGFETGWRSVELYDGGIGVLDNAAQFRLGRDPMESMFEAFERFGFAGMPKVFGHGEVDEEFALRVICRVSLDLNGAAKQVLQFDQGKQSEELRKLAQFLVETSEPAARNAGVTASSLGDALAKVAQGELAAETLDLTANRKPPVEDLKAGVPGWVLHVAGRRATARAYLPDGLGEDLELELTAEEIREVAAVLSKQEFDGLPRNLYSERYTDLAVRVLRWKKDVQARDFAGMATDSQPEGRRRFQAALQGIEKIALKVLREGTPSVD